MHDVTPIFNLKKLSVWVEHFSIEALMAFALRTLKFCTLDLRLVFMHIEVEET